MKKTLIFLSLLTLCLFGIMSNSTRAAAPMAAPGWDRPHEFTEISLTSVMNPQGQYLGRITDLLFGSEGQVLFAVISRPGILGMPGNPLAVPFNTLSYNDKQKVFVADISWERLQSAPVFTKEDLTNQKWAEDTYRYFGQQPAWTVGAEGKGSAVENRKEAMPVMGGWQRPSEASEIIRTHVMNLQGEDLGRIDDFVVDRNGRVAFVILAHGGFLRIGETLTAVPYSTLSSGDTGKHLVFDVTRERLESAPVFSKKTLGDLQWAEEVYRHFGQQPYWTEK